MSPTKGTIIGLQGTWDYSFLSPLHSALLGWLGLPPLPAVTQLSLPTWPGPTPWVRAASYSSFLLSPTPRHPIWGSGSFSIHGPQAFTSSPRAGPPGYIWPSPNLPGRPILHLPLTCCVARQGLGGDFVSLRLSGHVCKMGDLQLSQRLLRELNKLLSVVSCTQ